MAKSAKSEQGGKAEKPEKERLGKKIFSQGTVMAKGPANAPTPADEEPEEVVADEAEDLAEDADEMSAEAESGADADDAASGSAAGVEDREKWDPTKHKKQKHVKRTVFIVILCAAAVAALVYFFLLPPTISNNDVLNDFDVKTLESEQLTNSNYANNTGYTISDTKVTSIDDKGQTSKTAHVEATFENTNFSVVVECTQDFTLQGRIWRGGDVQIVSEKATPITSVDSNKVLADIANITSKIADKNGVKFSDIYADGTYDVMSNNLNKDKNQATVTIRAKKAYDLYSYSGDITATFDFTDGSGSQGDAGSWSLGDVTVEDSAWQQSYNSLVGKWTGTLDTTATSSLILNTGKCWAGKTTPFAMTVESMDTTSGAMVATMTFVSHNHGAIASDADGTPGDVVTTLTSVSMTLDPQTLTGTYEDPNGTEAEGTYTITLVNDKGVWKAQVASGLYETGVTSGISHVTFTDVYSLTRSSD